MQRPQTVWVQNSYFLAHNNFPSFLSSCFATMKSGGQENEVLLPFGSDFGNIGGMCGLRNSTRVLRDYVCLSPMPLGSGGD